MPPDTIRKITVFGLVGGGASLVHLAVAGGLDWAFRPSIFLSNTLGYLIGFVWSYLGHYYFTFRSGKDHRQAVPRFAATAIIGYLINTTVVAICVLATGTQSIWFIVVAIGIAAAAVYVISYHWALGGKT